MVLPGLYQEIIDAAAALPGAALASGAPIPSCGALSGDDGGLRLPQLGAGGRTASGAGGGDHRRQRPVDAGAPARDPARCG